MLTVPEKFFIGLQFSARLIYYCNLGQKPKYHDPLFTSDLKKMPV